MKNKIVYKINTGYNSIYETDKDGYVLKYSNGLNKLNSPKRLTKDWQITGLREKKPFGNIGKLISLKEAIKEELEYKNGKPKYYIEDIDHGTRRIHGENKYSRLKTYLN